MTHQPPTTAPPPGFRIDQRQTPADAIAFALWTFNREYANRTGEGLPRRVSVAVGVDLFADLAEHTDARREPRRWTRLDAGTLHCLGASIYRADAAVVTSPRGYRIVHNDELQPEAEA